MNFSDLRPTPEVRMELGISLLQSRRFNEAIKVLAGVADELPDNPAAHYNAYSGNSAAALADIETVRRSDPAMADRLSSLISP